MIDLTELSLDDYSSVLPRAQFDVGHAVDVIDDLSESLDSEPRFAKLAGAARSDKPVTFDVDTDGEV